MRFQRPPKIQKTAQIVPLIDILLVLLIYFIVTTQTKKPRDVMRIELPTVHEMPSGKEMATRSVIRMDAAGKVMLDSMAVPDGLLDSYLQAFMKQNPGRKLELEADKSMPIERLLAVWDALTKAGIQIKDVPARIRRPDQ